MTKSEIVTGALYFVLTIFQSFYCRSFVSRLLDSSDSMIQFVSVRLIH